MKIVVLLQTLMRHDIKFRLPFDRVFLVCLCAPVVELAPEDDLVLGDTRDGVLQHVLGGDEPGGLDEGVAVDTARHAGRLEDYVSVVTHAALFLVFHQVY